jgi:hypothetical protein
MVAGYQPPLQGAQTARKNFTTMLPPVHQGNLLFVRQAGNSSIKECPCCEPQLACKNAASKVNWTKQKTI